VTASGERVARILSRDYPESTLGWVKKLSWSGPQDVPLDQVNFTNQKKWNAWKEPERVAKFARRIAKRAKQGRRVKPVVIVHVPDDDGSMIVDGHHRSLAYQKLNKPIWAVTAKVPKIKGPWQELHAQQRAADTRSTTEDYGAVPASKSARWAAWEHDLDQAAQLETELTQRFLAAVDTHQIAAQWADIAATQAITPGSAESFLMSHAAPLRQALETALAPSWEQAWELGAASARNQIEAASAENR
jgi:hypothetical protein